MDAHHSLNTNPSMKVHPVDAESKALQTSAPKRAGFSQSTSSSLLSAAASSGLSSLTTPDGCQVDLSLRPGFCFPRFNSLPVERSFKKFTLKNVLERSGFAVQASLFAGLAAFAIVDTVTALASRSSLGAESALLGFRLTASALSICISLATLLNVSCLTACPIVFQAGNAGLVVRAVDNRYSCEQFSSNNQSEALPFVSSCRVLHLFHLA